jgi:hypothetical protein
MKNIETAKFGQKCAKNGQIVTCFNFGRIGNDLATEVCLFLSDLCLFLKPTKNEKSLQITEFVGFVLFLSVIVFRHQCG